MKRTYERLALQLYLLAFSVASSTEAFADNLVTCKKDAHDCGSNIELLVSPKMTRNVAFLNNTDYQHFWSAPYEQINKAFGVSDCGNYISNRDDSALVGWRNIPGTKQIELTGYVHRTEIRDPSSGVNFRSAPLGIVNQFESNAITIEALSDYYLYTLQTKSLLIMKRQSGCGNQMHGRYINTWFGGQKPAPETLSLSVAKITQPALQFPLNIRIADQDGICEKTAAAATHLNQSVSDYALQYITTHPTGVISKVASQCRTRHMSYQYMGCDSIATGVDSAGANSQYQSPNSIQGLNFTIECIPSGHRRN